MRKCMKYVAQAAAAALRLDSSDFLGPDRELGRTTCDTHEDEYDAHKDDEYMVI